MTLFCDSCQKEVKVDAVYEDLEGESRLKMYKLFCSECKFLIYSKKVIL